MSKSETNSTAGSRAEPEPNSDAQAIFEKLQIAGWPFRQQTHTIKFQDGSRLQFGVERKRFNSGWKIILNNANCPHCRKRAKEIKRNFPELPSFPELVRWMGDIIQVHSTSHRESPMPQQPERTVIRVKAAEDKGGARIKLLSQREGDVDAAPQRGARIKVNESPAVDDRRVTPAVSRTDETVRVIPLMEYRLDKATSVEVIIPISVCNQLMDHCRLSLEHGREVGGVMIGIKDDERGPSGNVSRYRVRVTDIIHFRAADSSDSRLHLDNDSWAHVSKVETERGYEGEGKVRLGWYHTHPIQGIFFSKWDRDFHTVFTTEFQFAIVVDPRNMEAGLFYWDDFARRVLIGPANFFLGQRRESNGAGSATPPRVEIVNDPSQRGKLSLGRAMFFVAPALLLLWIIIAAAPSFFLTADQIIILSMIPLLALSLWNIQWFHPVDPLELRMLTQFQQLVDRQTRAGDKPKPASFNPRNLVWVGIVIVLLLAALVISEVVRRSYKPHQSESPAATIGGGTGPQVNKNDPKPVKLSLVSSGSQRMILSSAGITPKVNYQLNGKNWNCNAKEEEEFYEQAFQWKLSKVNPQPYIKKLQTTLAESSADDSDGLWGPATRGLFLKKLRSVADANSRFDLSAPNNTVLSITVDHTETVAPDVVSVSHPPRRRKPTATATHPPPPHTPGRDPANPDKKDEQKRDPQKKNGASDGHPNR